MVGQKIPESTYSFREWTGIYWKGGLKGKEIILALIQYRSGRRMDI